MSHDATSSRSGSRSSHEAAGADRMAEDIEALLVEPLAALGLDVEGVEVRRAGRRRMLRVAVDQDGGVTMDDVAAATREVSLRLDESDVMGEQPYTLEVSSPGVDRPLTLPRHWRRNVDRLVAIDLADGDSVTGRVQRADDAANGSVVLLAEGEERVVAYAEVVRARVQVELNRKDR